MRRCRGSLRDILRERQRLTPKQATLILSDVINGLEYAWDSFRALHLDLKPENILFHPDLERGLGTDEKDGLSEMHFMVSDWGIASVKQQQLNSIFDLSANDPDTLRTLNNIGTAAYMGPERFVRGRRSSFASDVFGLGMIQLELLTGTLPFSSLRNAAAELLSGAYMKLASAILQKSHVSENAQRFVLWCIAPESERRPRSYAELKGALAQCTPREGDKRREKSALPDKTTLRELRHFMAKTEPRRALVAAKTEYLGKQIENLRSVGRSKEVPDLIAKYFVELINEWALAPDDPWSLQYLAHQSITLQSLELGRDTLESILNSSVAKKKLDMTFIYLDLGCIYHQLSNNREREMWCYEMAVSALAPPRTRFAANATDKARCHLFAASCAGVMQNEERANYHEAKMRELVPSVNWTEPDAVMTFLKEATPKLGI